LITGSSQNVAEDQKHLTVGEGEGGGRGRGREGEEGGEEIKT
jgi:hypothetical protein